MTADAAIAPGEHVVQFYEEPELARTVGRYVSDTVQAGAAAIVIATDTHRRAFEAELEAAGIDVTSCLLDGTLILLDAAGTLREFMGNGRVDHEWFRRVIGSVVRQAGQTGGASPRLWRDGGTALGSRGCGGRDRARGVLERTVL